MRSTPSRVLFRALCLLLWACLPLAASAAPTQAETAGEEAFFQRDFKKAAKAFRAVTKAAPRSAEAWYNLGTAQAEAGRMGRAIHAFEQSLLLDPDDPDARHNLEQSRSRAIKIALGTGGEARVVLPGEDDTGTGFLTSFSAASLAVVFGLSWSLLFITLTILRRTHRSGIRAATTVAAVLSALAALGAGGLLYGQRGTQDIELAVVTSRQVVSRPGPGRQYKGSALVTGGVKVQIQGADGDWRKVTLPDGSDGWLEARHLTRLTR